MANEVMQKDMTVVKAELDMQITTAKAYPRDVNRFLQEATALATIDEETAESCIYSLPRGKDSAGKQAYLKGESIRLAEIIISAWGNLHAATRIIENDGSMITAEGVAWDLEKNVRVAKQVKRSIKDRNGKTFSGDMQVVTGNAASSIALRNAIFSVIPRAFVKRVYDSAVKVAIGDQSKLTQKIKILFERFKKWGIDQQRILTYFGKNDLSEISADEVEEMIGIGTAIKENNLSIDNAFIRMENNTGKVSELEEMLGKNGE